MIRIFIKRAKFFGWYFKIVASNGKILCHSQRYTRKINCYNAAALIVGSPKEIITED